MCCSVPRPGQWSWTWTEGNLVHFSEGPLFSSPRLCPLESRLSPQFSSAMQLILLFSLFSFLCFLISKLHYFSLSLGVHLSDFSYSIRNRTRSPKGLSCWRQTDIDSHPKMPLPGKATYPFYRLTSFLYNVQNAIQNYFTHVCELPLACGSVKSF